MADCNNEQFVLDKINEASSQYRVTRKGTRIQYFNEGNDEGNEDEQQDCKPNVGAKRARGQRGITKKVEGRHIITEVTADGRPVASHWCNVEIYVTQQLGHEGSRAHQQTELEPNKVTRGCGTNLSPKYGEGHVVHHHARDLHSPSGRTGQSEEVDYKKDGWTIAALQKRFVPQIYPVGPDIGFWQIPQAKGSLGCVRRLQDRRGRASEDSQESNQCR